MARYVVDVMPKREILDPQGKAVLGALPRLGFEGVTDVRQGKRFEVDVDGEADDERLAAVRRMAETLLANPVIEYFTVTVDGAPETLSAEPETPSVEPESPPVEPVETTPEPTSPGPEDTAERPVVRHDATAEDPS